MISEHYITDPMIAESQLHNYKSDNILLSDTSIGDSSMVRFQYANSILLVEGFNLNQGSLNRT